MPVLVAGATLLLLVASALVAFHGMPLGRGAAPLALPSIGDDTATRGSNVLVAPASRPSVAARHRSAGRPRATTATTLAMTASAELLTSSSSTPADVTSSSSPPADVAPPASGPTAPAPARRSQPQPQPARRPSPPSSPGSHPAGRTPAPAAPVQRPAEEPSSAPATAQAVTPPVAAGPADEAPPVAAPVTAVVDGTRLP